MHVFFTSAQVGDEWSASHPGRFIPGERAPVPIGQEAGWGSEQEKSYPCQEWNSNPSAVEPLASSCTDVCAKGNVS
jgi:hypothetical protein